MKAQLAKDWLSALRLGALLLLLLLSNLGAKGGYAAIEAATCEDCKADISQITFGIAQVRLRENEARSVSASVSETANWSSRFKPFFLESVTLSPTQAASTTISLKAKDDFSKLTQPEQVVDIRADEVSGYLNIYFVKPRLRDRFGNFNPRLSILWPRVIASLDMVVEDSLPGVVWNFSVPNQFGIDRIEKITVFPFPDGQSANFVVGLNPNLRFRKPFFPLAPCVESVYIVLQATEGTRTLGKQIVVKIMAERGTPPCPL